MDFQAKAAIVFILLLALVLYLERKKLDKQQIIPNVIYLLMYKTKVGLKLMDSIARRYSRAVKYFGYAGIVAGFLGMILISVIMVSGTYNLFFVEGSRAAVGIVQPFKENVPGTFFVPFFYLIISILVLVVVHEFSHGVMARLYKLRIKSSGLAFFGIILPIIPAAFVEPDEQKLVKRPRLQQLSIFAAGPFSNILLAFVIFAVIALTASPIVDAMVDYDGVLVTGLIKEDGRTYPAEAAGMSGGEVIKEVNGISIITAENLSNSIKGRKPGDVVHVVTNKTSYDMTLAENPANKSMAYMGVYLKQNTAFKPGFREGIGSIAAKTTFWILQLLIWMYALNLGVGLFNLIPIPICDGGRMMQLALERYMTKEQARKAWKIIASVFLLLIIINLGVGFFK